MHLAEPSFRGLLSGLGNLQTYIEWAALLGHRWREHDKRVPYAVYSKLPLLHFSVGSEGVERGCSQSKDMKAGQRKKLYSHQLNEYYSRYGYKLT